MHHWQINLWRWHFHWLWSYHFDKWRDSVTLKDLRKWVHEHIHEYSDACWTPSEDSVIMLVIAYRKKFPQSSLANAKLAVEFMLEQEKSKK